MKKEIMEPSDFDKILREKLHENPDLHTQEMDAAKPFIWSAVYDEIGRKKTLTWYHLAAAVILLLLTFSVVIYNLQNSHQQELADLSSKMDQLEKNYVSQVELIQSKDIQLSSMKNELENVNKRFANLDLQKPLPQKERIIYQTDTVYVKQVEYVTMAAKENKMLTTTNKDQNISQAELSEPDNQKFDDIIYPSFSKRGKKEKSESIKLEFSPFTARNN